MRYFKIETPGTAAKLRALIDAGGPAIAGPFDGEESITLIADLQAGDFVRSAHPLIRRFLDAARIPEAS